MIHIPFSLVPKSVFSFIPNIHHTHLHRSIPFIRPLLPAYPYLQHYLISVFSSLFCTISLRAAVATVRYVLQVHPCGRYRHNTVVFILAKEYNLKNLRTIHRLDRLTSGLLLFGRSPKKARQMEHQIRNRQVQKEYVCRVEGEFPE